MFNIIEVNGGTLRITTAFSFYLKKMNILCAHCGKILPVNNDNKNIEQLTKKRSIRAVLILFKAFAFNLQ